MKFNRGPSGYVSLLTQGAALVKPILMSNYYVNEWLSHLSANRRVISCKYGSVKDRSPWPWMGPAVRGTGTPVGQVVPLVDCPENREQRQHPRRLFQMSDKPTQFLPLKLGGHIAEATFGKVKSASLDGVCSFLVVTHTITGQPVAMKYIFKAVIHTTRTKT